MLDTAYLAAALPLSYRKSETNSLEEGVGFEPTRDGVNAPASFQD